MDCCHGVRRSYSTCPVAEWLLVITGLHVLVGPDFWLHEDSNTLGGLPDNVERFVAGFDARHYPLLDVGVP